MKQAIVIVRTPGGEAPQWVRQAWVGLILPCDSFLDHTQTRGVISSKENTRRECCYSVPQKEALEILEMKDPRAAAWWRSHDFPKTNPAENRFAFSEADAVVARGAVSSHPVIVYDDMETGRMEPWIFPRNFPGAR